MYGYIPVSRRTLFVTFVTQNRGVYTRRDLTSQYAFENASGLLSTTMIDDQWGKEKGSNAQPTVHTCLGTA